jgi:hypothetical protein
MENPGTVQDTILSIQTVPSILVSKRDDRDVRSIIGLCSQVGSSNIPESHLIDGARLLRTHGWLNCVRALEEWASNAKYSQFLEEYLVILDQFHKFHETHCGPLPVTTSFTD